MAYFSRTSWATELSSDSQRLPRGSLEHVSDAVAGLRRALDVRIDAQLARQLVAVVGRHQLRRAAVPPQVDLGGDEDDRCVAAVMADLGHPLHLHVVEAGDAVDGEADDDGVRAPVAERPQSVVVLLAGRVPQHQHWPTTVLQLQSSSHTTIRLTTFYVFSRLFSTETYEYQPCFCHEFDHF